MATAKKSKKSLKKIPTSVRSQASKESLLAVIAFVLPFFAWLIAAVINPSGWASDDPSTVITAFALVVIGWWPIALFACLIIVIYFVRDKPSVRHTTVLLLTISVIYSAYIYQLTVTADESEFTG
ncbi:MAG: hypothetical protein JWP06_629 [Candidatus Saccharibacteria bacterium]|nr:hypothetical protein [Candidatus Saccharibacteria bacterium]